MKICYKCFHRSEESALFCEHCGFSLNYENEDTYADALTCGTTLYGRYLVGQVLQQSDSSITYLAQDSRTKGSVAVREYFPKEYCVRTSMRTVGITEENREQFQDAFQEGKELFLQTAEDLFDEIEEDSEQIPCVQSYFSQNSTAYMVIDYGSQENLQAFLEGKILTAKTHQAKAAASGTPIANNTHQAKAEETNRSAAETAETATRASTDTDSDEGIVQDIDGVQDKSGVPDGSIVHGTGGSPRRSFLPLAFILGIFAALILILLLLLPRALAGFDGMGKSVRSIYEEYRGKYTELFEKQKKDFEIENPFKQIENIIDDDTEDTDIPDDDPEDMYYWSGITSGNFYNRGYYILYDDEYFFSDASGFYRSSNEDPDEHEKISNICAAYLNEYEGYLYYLNEYAGTIVCYDPDDDSSFDLYDSEGKEEFAPQSLYIYDGRCYFSSENNLYCFNMEDVEFFTTLHPENVDLLVNDYNTPGWVNESLCFAGDYLIYNGADGITALDLNSFPGKKVISDQEGNLISNGKDIFCWFGTHKIYRIGLNGESEEIVSTAPEERITSFNCCGDQVYFTIESDEYTEIRRMSDDGVNEDIVGMTGLDGANVFSFCVFPESENAYVYLLLNKDGKISFTHDIVPLK